MKKKKKEYYFDEKYLPVFATKMTRMYKQWQKDGADEPKTLEGLAERIANINGSDCNKNSPSLWKNGKQRPTKANVDALIQIFGCSEDDLLPSGHDEEYVYSSDHINRFGDKLSRFAVKKGLSLYFLRALKEIYPDLDSKFPLFTPFTRNNDFLSPKMFIRKSESNASDSAKMNDQNKVFQFKRDGKTITLSPCDVLFLIDVQEQVKKTIDILFAKRRQEMENELEMLNKIYDIKSQDEQGIAFTGTVPKDFPEYVKLIAKYTDIEEEWNGINS